MNVHNFTLEDFQGLVEKVIKTGKKHYHKNYDRTVEVAKFCYQVMTGDDQENILIRFKRRENKDQEEQRVHLTNSRTQFVGGKVYSVFNELKRASKTVEVIKYLEESDANKEKISEIKDRLSRFYEGEHAREYTYENVRYLNFYDPNAFLIVNFQDFDYKREKTPGTYPVEVYSDQAIKYEYVNGELAYLLFYQEVEIEDLDDQGKEVTKKDKQYVLFAPNVAIYYKPLPKKKEAEIEPGFTLVELAQETYDEGSNTSFNEESIKKFQYKVFDTKSKKIPAIRVGYIKDPKTRKLTCVSPLHYAEKLLIDLIWTKSEYDLAKALHWFYHKFIYAPRCDYVDPKNSQDFCLEGLLQVSGGKCQMCDGTGLKIHTTVQDTIVLELPNNKEEIVPLENMVHYEKIDPVIIQEHKKDLVELQHDVFKAVFNAQTFERSEIAISATEKKLDVRAMKNTLIDFGNQVSRIYMHIVEMTAIYLDNDQGLVVQHQHHKDLRLETIDDLINQRERLVKAGAPYETIKNVDLAILSEQHMEDSEIVPMIAAKERFRPFREKSEKERMFLLSKMGSDDYHRILWVFFEDIMEEVFFEDKERDIPWYKLKYTMQKQIIDEKVKKIQAQEKRKKEEMIDQFSMRAALDDSDEGDKKPEPAPANLENKNE